jgi:diacylglycerol O-acyltransferase
MKALTSADQAFLWMENRQQPMHVGGLQLFNIPEDAGPMFITDLMESLYSYSQPLGPFADHLVSKRGRYYWEEDKLFDIEHHVSHQALPKPGRVRELLSHVSAEHSHLMDRSRPLWEFHVIEGLKRRQIAVYSKIHHSMIDGISAMRLLSRSLSTDPNTRNMPPIWMQQPHKKVRRPLKPSTALESIIEGAQLARSQLSALPHTLAEASRSYRGISEDPDLVNVRQAPQCILNEEITGSRRFAAQSFPIERFKVLSKKFNVTLNDILLAVCGSALRNYLISQHALPDKPLISMVPMSIREKDDTELGNQIASILANLGTHVADPVDRLEIVHRSIVAAKNLYSGMSQSEIINYTSFMMIPAGIHMLTGKAPAFQTYNVTISNVPGPKEKLYWNGAELDGIYPVSIPLNHNALNITILSYGEQFEIGFTACRKTLPSMQRLLDYVENGISELEVAGDIPMRGASSNKAKKAKVNMI